MACIGNTRLHEGVARLLLHGAWVDETGHWPLAGPWAASGVAHMAECGWGCCMHVSWDGACKEGLHVQGPATLMGRMAAPHHTIKCHKVGNKKCGVAVERGQVQPVHSELGVVGIPRPATTEHDWAVCGPLDGAWGEQVMAKLVCGECHEEEGSSHNSEVVPCGGGGMCAGVVWLLHGQ